MLEMSLPLMDLLQAEACLHVCVHTEFQGRLKGRGKNVNCFRSPAIEEIHSVRFQIPELGFLGGWGSYGKEGCLRYHFVKMIEQVCTRKNTNDGFYDLV